MWLLSHCEGKKKSREEIVNSPKIQHSVYEQLFSGPCRLDKLVWVEPCCLCMWLISMSPVPKIVGVCQSHVALTRTGILQPSPGLRSPWAGAQPGSVPLLAWKPQLLLLLLWKTGLSSLPCSKWSKRACK